MADIRFNCAGCGARLKIDDKAAGYLAPCPHCGKQNQVPVTSTLLEPPSSSTMRIEAPTPAPPQEAPVADAAVATLRQRVSTLEGDKTRLENSLRESAAQAQAWTRERADLQARLQESTAALKKADSSAQEWARERANLQARIQEGTDAIQRSRELETNLAGLESSLHDLEQKSAVLESEKTELENKLKDLSAAIDSQSTWQTEKTKLEDKLIEAAYRADVLSRENFSLQSRLKVLSAAVRSKG